MQVINKLPSGIWVIWYVEIQILHHHWTDGSAQWVDFWTPPRNIHSLTQNDVLPSVTKSTCVNRFHCSTMPWTRLPVHLSCIASPWWCHLVKLFVWEGLAQREELDHSAPVTPLHWYLQLPWQQLYNRMTITQFSCKHIVPPLTVPLPLNRHTITKQSSHATITFYLNNYVLLFFSFPPSRDLYAVTSMSYTVYKLM